jgi:hypothetical protein
VAAESRFFAGKKNIRKIRGEQRLTLDSVFGIIDGTGVEIASPSGTSQRASYRGHKRQNCLKFQAISAPDELLLHLFGPVEGRRHDMFLYNESRLDNVLMSSMFIAERKYYLYGDPD